MRLLLTQTTVSEEQAETPQITETATGTVSTQGRIASLAVLFPDVSQEEIEAVMRAYHAGVQQQQVEQTTRKT